MAKTTLKTYMIGAYVHVLVEQAIKAESLDHAVQIGQKLEFNDFVDVHGCCNDSRLEIVQIYNTESEL